jgi:hypothetical protein
MMRQEFTAFPSLLPEAGQPYEQATTAFGYAVRPAFQCSGEFSRYIGGQYLSRAHRGDPGAKPPIVPTPLADEQRAFGMLDKYIFSDATWNLSPRLLSELGYSEWAGYGYVQLPGYGNLPGWAYDPPHRHYESLAALVGEMQDRAIRQMFDPWVLQRLDDNPGLAVGEKTMSMSDLFAWMRKSVYGDVGHGSLSLLRRNLQDSYEKTLIGLAKTPSPNAPEDAQAFARVELAWIADTAGSAARRTNADAATHAHLELLQSRAADALATRP